LFYKKSCRNFYSYIEEQLSITKIVSSIPNIPTQIGEGMTVFCASQAVDRKELFIVQNLINAT
jgi:pyrroline-5-carboxylate reductase